MNKTGIRKLVAWLMGMAALVAAAIISGEPQPLLAADYMCHPLSASGAQTRRVTNPATGNSYVLNGRGCSNMDTSDIPYFTSQGFVDYSTAGAGGTAVTGNRLVFTNPDIYHIVPISGTTLDKLAQNIIFTSNSYPMVVADDSEVDYMRLSRETGYDNVNVIGANSVVAGLDFHMTSNNSSISSNMYGVIGAVTNNGPGTTKALYGRAIATANSTGVVMGLVGAVTCSSQQTAGECYIVQLTGSTSVNGGNVDAALWVASDTESGSHHANFRYGLLLDGYVDIIAGGAALQGTANGAGNFLTWQVAGQTYNIFTVDNKGHVILTEQSPASSVINLTNDILLQGPFDLSTFLPTTLTVSASNELDHIRISGGAGNATPYKLNANSVAAGLNFQMQTVSNSASTANMYGVIGSLTNQAGGATKAIYGRSAASSTASGVTIALVGAVGCATNQPAQSCYTVQLTGDTATNGGVQDAVVWFTSGVTSPVNINYGFLLDGKVNIQAGGAAVQAAAVGSGAFLNFQNSAQTINLWQINSSGQEQFCGSTSGCITIKPQAVAGTYNWNLPIAAGSSGNVLISGGGGAAAMSFTDTLASMASITSTALIGTTVTGGATANGINITAGSITRNLAAGGIIFEAGTDAGNSIRLNTGGTTRLTITDGNVAATTLTGGVPTNGIDITAGNLTRNHVNGSFILSAGTAAGNSIQFNTGNAVRLTISDTAVNVVAALTQALATPAAAASACTATAIEWDANFIYVCTASGAWKRVAIATW